MDIKKLKSHIINNFYSDSGRFISSRVNNQYRNLIIEYTNELNIVLDQISLNERVYLIVNDLNTNICKICKTNKLHFITNKKGYREYCSRKCSANSIIKQNKIKETCLTKYGATSNLVAQADQIAKTNLKKYGNKIAIKSTIIKQKTAISNFNKVQNYLKKNYSLIAIIKSKNVKIVRITSNLSHIVDSVRATKLKRYNDINYNNRKKATKTNLEKYGVTNVAKLSSVKQKKEETNLERYGSRYIFVSHKKQIEETNLERYGYKIASKSDIIKLKLRKDKHYSQTHIDHLKEWRDDLLFTNIYDSFEYVDEVCSYFNVTYDGVLTKITKLNLKNKKRRKTKKQNEIVDYIKSLGITNIIVNDRNTIKPLELDIYLPDYNLAIEYNSFMYHSYGKSKVSMFDNYHKLDRQYHLKKTRLCEDQNIKLLHIFEDLYTNKKNIINSMISQNLNQSTNRIYARKTTVKKIDNSVIKDFLNSNHIQGHINSNINYGLYYNNELVSVMTFAKSRFNKNYDYELLRYCNLINHTVVGGFSKLLNQFKCNYKNSNFITYADRTFVSLNKNVYKSVDLKYVKINPPSYFYIKNNSLDRINRLSCQKHKLVNLLDNYDPKLSERDNMINNNYRIVYDCGTFAYEYID